MENMIFDIQKFREFSDDGPNKKTMWAGKTSKINIICLRPGQEIKPHVHDGDHIWIIVEGRGEFLSSDSGSQEIDAGRVAIVPQGEEHGIRNNTKEDLVFASITA